MNQIKSIAEFVEYARFANAGEIHFTFEHNTTESCRRAIYACSDEHSYEPFRSACITLGLKHNIQSLIQY